MGVLGKLAENAHKDADQVACLSALIDSPERTNALAHVLLVLGLDGFGESIAYLVALGLDGSKA